MKNETDTEIENTTYLVLFLESFQYRTWQYIAFFRAYLITMLKALGKITSLTISI